jgi:hypothetical protein
VESCKGERARTPGVEWSGDGATAQVGEEERLRFFFLETSGSRLRPHFCSIPVVSRLSRFSSAFDSGIGF